jgi:hypothetical protein
MPFTETELDMLLADVGEEITVSLYGATVATVTARFRKDYQAVDGYQTGAGALMPGMLCKSSAAAAFTAEHVFTRANSEEYRLNGMPQEQPSGLSVVPLKINYDMAGAQVMYPDDTSVLTDDGAVIEGG